jgi:hypothetical protein
MNQAIKGKLGRYWHVLETVASMRRLPALLQVGYVTGDGRLV